MSRAITFEVIVETNPDYGNELSIELPVAIHIHKRLEQFIYTNSIKEDSVPIAYLGNPEVDAWKNLLITNKAHSVIPNSLLLLQGERRFDSVISTSYSSPYSSIIATDRSFTDSKGKNRPLFFRHELPVNTTEASIYEVNDGNKTLADEGFVVDVDSRSIYTNYQNSFDVDSGSYRLFFVNASTSDGEVVNSLLNAYPVAREAGWQDIDLETGDLIDDYPLYSKSKSGTGYTFYFNRGAKWFIKLQDRGLIQPLRPRAKRPDAPWYIRFTAGDVSGLVNQAVRRYYIPEFSSQPFVPYSPIKFANREDMLFVNKKILAATRKNLFIDPAKGFHLEIRVEDEEGNLLKIYTTDTTIHDIRYSDTEVFYESDKIASWDNPEGFIELAVSLFPNRRYFAKYYYEVEDYEYTLVNLNPISNRKLKDHMYVFYCIPDVHSSDRAIHYLLVDSDGVIIETSQNLGIGHPNLQLTDALGNYNSETIIGMLYSSEIYESFISEYSANATNDNGYMIIAEVSGIDISLPEDQVEVDVRQPGGIIAEEFYQSAVIANPRLLQSRLGYGPDGQVVPEANVMVLEAPLSLLTDYGGLLSEERAEELLRANMPVTGYAVIDWVYPKSEVDATSFTAGIVEVSYTWEGPFTYRLYRRVTRSSDWILLNQEVNPARGTLAYTDITVDSGSIYDYAIRIVDNSIEYPYSDPVSIKVR